MSPHSRMCLGSIIEPLPEEVTSRLEHRLVRHPAMRQSGLPQRPGWFRSRPSPNPCAQVWQIVELESLSMADPPVRVRWAAVMLSHTGVCTHYVPDGGGGLPLAH